MINKKNAISISHSLWTQHNVFSLSWDITFSSWLLGASLRDY